MFLKYLLFLVALLQFGESQPGVCQCVNDFLQLKVDIQRDTKTLNRTMSAGNKVMTNALVANHNITRNTVQQMFEALNWTVTAGNEFIRDILTSKENATRQTFQELLEDKATKEDVRALNQTVTAWNELTANAWVASHNVTRNTVQQLLQDKATKEDVRQRASEVIQALNHSVTTGNQEVVDILTDTKSLVEATHTAVEQEQCVTREEVNSIIRAEVQSIVRNEIQSLVNYVAEAQRNNTALLIDLLTYQHPVPSCKNIPQGTPSGDYWIQTNSSTPVQRYCDMTRTSCCNSTGGWMRVANIDMTDPNQQCPPGFRLVNSPRRTCGRHGHGCVSTTFPVHGVEYSRVCGRVIGYQFGHPDAFYRGQTNIDSNYVEGVSLTHGISPRRHIWTFANALDETHSDSNTCPCTRPDLTYTGRVPSFIGEDYFCETGSRGQVEYRFYFEDPLWDGQGCGPQSTCCSFNNPPWFCKQLPQPTRDDIELRLCASWTPSDEDSPLEIAEIYVQ